MAPLNHKTASPFNGTQLFLFFAVFFSIRYLELKENIFGIFTSSISGGGGDFRMVT